MPGSPYPILSYVYHWETTEMTRPPRPPFTMMRRRFNVIGYKLTGVWSTINPTTHMHRKQPFYNSEPYKRTGVYARQVTSHK